MRRIGFGVSFTALLTALPVSGFSQSIESTVVGEFGRIPTMLERRTGAMVKRGSEGTSGVISKTSLTGNGGAYFADAPFLTFIDLRATATSFGDDTFEYEVTRTGVDLGMEFGSWANGGNGLVFQVFGGTGAGEATTTIEDEDYNETTEFTESSIGFGSTLFTANGFYADAAGQLAFIDIDNEDESISVTATAVELGYSYAVNDQFTLTPNVRYTNVQSDYGTDTDFTTQTGSIGIIAAYEFDETENGLVGALYGLANYNTNMGDDEGLSGGAGDTMELGLGANIGLPDSSSTFFGEVRNTSADNDFDYNRFEGRIGVGLDF